MARLNKARLERTEWLYIDYWRATIWHQLARKTEINTARDEQTLNSGERSQTIRSGRGSNEGGGGRHRRVHGERSKQNTMCADADIYRTRPPKDRVIKPRT